jgi:hypothetical protein
VASVSVTHGSILSDSPSSASFLTVRSHTPNIKYKQSPNVKYKQSLRLTMADPPTSASGDPASGADANAHDPAALVVEYINNNPEPGNNPAAVTLTVNSQEHQNDDDVEEEDVDPFSLLPLHQPHYHPVCHKIILLCGAIMAHQNNTVLPIQVVEGLMEEMREW